jgi:hypothetical protein
MHRCQNCLSAGDGVSMFTVYTITGPERVPQCRDLEGCWRRRQERDDAATLAVAGVRT